MLANTLLLMIGDKPGRLTLPSKMKIYLVHTLNLTFYTSLILIQAHVMHAINILVHFQQGNDSSHLYFFALQRSHALAARRFFVAGSCWPGELFESSANTRKVDSVLMMKVSRVYWSRLRANKFSTWSQRLNAGESGRPNRGSDRDRDRDRNRLT